MTRICEKNAGGCGLEIEPDNNNGYCRRCLMTGDIQITLILLVAASFMLIPLERNLVTWLWQVVAWLCTGGCWGLIAIHSIIMYYVAGSRAPKSEDMGEHRMETKTQQLQQHHWCSHCEEEEYDDDE